MTNQRDTKKVGFFLYIILSTMSWSTISAVLLDIPSQTARFENDGMWGKVGDLIYITGYGARIQISTQGGNLFLYTTTTPPWIGGGYVPEDGELLSWAEQQTFTLPPISNPNTLAAWCVESPGYPRSASLDVQVRNTGYATRFNRWNVMSGLVRCDGSPPKPASCQTFPPASIDFGTVDPKEISGKKATSQVLVWCDKKASVRVRFMTREGLAIFQMDNGLTTYLKIDDNPGTAGSYQTVAENASSPARAFNLSAELLGTSGSVKPGAFSYTAVVRVDIL